VVFLFRGFDVNRFMLISKNCFILLGPHVSLLDLISYLHGNFLLYSILYQIAGVALPLNNTFVAVLAGKCLPIPMTLIWHLTVVV
jgi:hypothetical protein